MHRFKFLHPLLFAAFPILAFYTKNIHKVRFDRIILPLEFSIGFTLGLWLFLNGLIKDRYKTSLLVTYFLLLFYSYGQVYKVLDGFLVKNGEKDISLFVLWSAFLLIGSFLIIKFGRKLRGLEVFPLVTGGILVLVSLIQIAGYNLNNNKVLFAYNDTTKTNKQLNNLNQNFPVITDRPDIYYIILDGYASNEVLKNIYGYDNINFVNFLESKDFNIAYNAHSNYALTHLSLASSLNMKYVSYLTDQIAAINMIKDNEVLKILKSKDYQAVHFNSGWVGTQENNFADLNVSCGVSNQFIATFLKTTMLRTFNGMYLSDKARDRVLCTFSQLASIRENVDGPMFVFAHIVSPHPPYLFGPNGEQVKLTAENKVTGLDTWQDRKDYLNQLLFINKMVMDLVRKLTFGRENSPIIIIQADHGSASTPGMEEYNPDLIQERMRPFIAYKLPDKEKFTYDNLTPVNIFRLIFNNYFNARYELLEDKYYFSNYSRPFEFIDVTESVNQFDMTSLRESLQTEE
ncbi:MAG: hypothetical protein UT54_C0057G0007 [Candidatus Daviesbacteria bacterium GW2011_GWB1_39_5]|uniref:Sulfatase N-terminal domain-containing protein n=1 Tax=Candidatus Daviesbacteria bacterium RIFCSPHIGHO2_01_FULL_40_11 TaxID=1797762 RepID=A0A1F5JGZ3_9BACT|nr:MAG: hypothetical protein UT54_C0057G0007 [Candidatus Daviesbacteria bacterium GW2011_GWB1_39_5]OGE27876.1 MAG: hypothetical protein A2867_02285 [Candidatus Daviesbacteria bacterium RIFCSPHIGHO2_01_FULL_40_11]